MPERKTSLFDPQTERNLKIWLDGPVDENEKSELEKLVITDPQEIIDSFYKRLEFGTGGLRGVMGIGINKMNRYTVAMATQGLANYLLNFPPENDRHAVFIGYDSRHKSRFFAEVAAKVLAANDILVFLCSELRPTPLVSFGCRQKNCSAAIMVTASHNPPEYNGYKVYWSDGGQVVPPHDQGIIDEVKAINDLYTVKMFSGTDNPLIVNVGEEIDNAYLKAIRASQLYPKENAQNGQMLKIVYTSLHGTGVILVPKALHDWGFHNFILVESQCEPNGDFPTVKCPNPEEPKALEMGIDTMKKQQADLLIANDPDADRMGVVVMQKGEPVILNGNQIACICLHHICEALTTQNRMPQKAAFIKTIATTELFKAIAESYGGTCFDVLTGFKYIAEKILEWEQDPNGFEYIFGGEESYGYLLGKNSRDKDAVISSALISEAALHAKLQGKTLIDQLLEIYRKYGVYHEMLVSIKFEESKSGRERMAKGMEILQYNPPKMIGGTPVEYIEDYEKSLKTNLKNGQSEPLALPKSDAYLFWLEDGTKVLIRPSGTEPKIKIYCGVVNKNSKNVDNAIAECKEKGSYYLTEMRKLFNQDT